MTLNFKMCRAITVLDLWAMTASFYWLLIEGIQLYTLLVVTVFSVKNRVVYASHKSYPRVKKFILLGYQ